MEWGERGREGGERERGMDVGWRGRGGERGKDRGRVKEKERGKEEGERDGLKIPTVHFSFVGNNPENTTKLAKEAVST